MDFIAGYNRRGFPAFIAVACVLVQRLLATPLPLSAPLRLSPTCRLLVYLGAAGFYDTFLFLKNIINLKLFFFLN